MKKQKRYFKWTLSQWWFYVIVLMHFFSNVLKYKIYDGFFLSGLIVGSFLLSLIIITFFRFLYLIFKKKKLK